MVILIDTREQVPLTFAKCEGVETIVQMLPVGDYSARGSRVVIERKSVADLYGSYTANYDAERAKIVKAKELGLKFILAIEGSVFDIRSGYSYWKNGEQVESKRSGISMIRTLLTVSRKYDIPIWWCNSRKEMSFLIMEYLLADEKFTKTEQARKVQEDSKDNP